MSKEVTALDNAQKTPWEFSLRQSDVGALVESHISRRDFPYAIWVPSELSAVGRLGMLVFGQTEEESRARAELACVAVNSHEKAIELAKAVLKSHRKPAIWAGKPKKRLTFTCKCLMCLLARMILLAGKKPKGK